MDRRRDDADAGARPEQCVELRRRDGAAADDEDVAAVELEEYR